MIKLINVEEPLQNALKTIGWYCKHNDCKTCGLKINDDTCITDKDPDVWWMYLNAYRNDEPQTEYDKYREKIRPHDPHKDWFEDESQTERSTQ